MRMDEIYLDWPRLAEKGLDDADDVHVERFKPRSIVVIGMGGSGILGDYLKTLAYDAVPVYVVKGPRPPGWIG